MRKNTNKLNNPELAQIRRMYEEYWLAYIRPMSQSQDPVSHQYISAMNPGATEPNRYPQLVETAGNALHALAALAKAGRISRPFVPPLESRHC